MSGARARPATLLLLLLAIALAAVGTAIWIAAILRPAPTVPAGTARAVSRQGDTLALIVDVGASSPFDRAGASVADIARTIATGRLPPPAPRLVAFDFRAGTVPLMRLLYDPGVLASGAVSGGDGDHLLGLAGSGSRLPASHDPALIAYCGRMETMTKPFCTRATRGEGG